MCVFNRPDIDQKYVFFKDFHQILIFFSYMVLFEYVFSLALLNLNHNQTEELYDWKNH